MRVITGTAKGRRLQAPSGLDTRPTADRIKEAVFSIVQFEVEGADVLDLFAGSGQIGIEALSRGAHSCVFVDSANDCKQAQRSNLRNTGLLDNRVRVVRSDVFSFLKSCTRQFDIAYIDPPYAEEMAGKLLPAVAGCMRPGGAILCEAGREELLPAQAGDFQLQREYTYGKTKVALYRHADSQEEDQ